MPPRLAERRGKWKDSRGFTGSQPALGSGPLVDEIDLPAARELWTRLWPLCSFLEKQSYSAAVKTACALVGDTTGPTRPPLLALEDDATSELARLLERAGAHVAGTVGVSH